MATFMASIESVQRISGLLYRGSVQGWKVIVAYSLTATDDRSRLDRMLLLHNNATISSD